MIDKDFKEDESPRITEADHDPFDRLGKLVNGLSEDRLEALNEHLKRGESMKEVLTIRGAGELLGFSIQTMRKLVKQKGFPAHYIRNEYRFLRSELLDWISKQDNKAPSRPDRKNQRRARPKKLR